MPAEVVLTTLRHVWSRLEPLHLPMALMGGLAMSAWKHVRATQDVDVLINLGSSDVSPVLKVLQEGGARLKRHPPVLPLGPVRLVQLLYEPPGAFMDVQVDLLFADSEYPKEALARRVATKLPGLDVAIEVLACEDLILHKLLAGRVIDRIDGAALLRLHRGSLNMAYLQGWVARLGVDAEWSEIWNAAFPGKALPGALPPAGPSNAKPGGPIG